MSHRIIRLRQARTDLIETALYLEEHSPDAAPRFLAAVEDALALLAEMPGAGAERHLNNPALQGPRMPPVKGFERHLIFYRPTSAGIELIRLYHAARDVDEIVRTRLEQVEQGAPLIPHEEAVRHIEDRMRRK